MEGVEGKAVVAASVGQGGGGGADKVGGADKGGGADKVGGDNAASPI